MIVPSSSQKYSASSVLMWVQTSLQTRTSISPKKKKKTSITHHEDSDLIICSTMDFLTLVAEMALIYY